jgi:hypothetical protein
LTVWGSTITIEEIGSRSRRTRAIAARRPIARAHTPFERQRRHWTQTVVQAARGVCFDGKDSAI